MALRFKRLDRDSVRKLKAGESIVENGITAERVASGDIRWSVNIMVDGVRVHRAIGFESDGVTRTQAEEFIEAKRSDARSGRLNLPKGRKLALTFSAAADLYVKAMEETGGKNLKVKRRQIRMYLKPHFGAMRLDAITTFTVGRYKKQRLGDGAAAGTINRELATLSHLFSLAASSDLRWLDRRPCEIKKEAEGEGRIIALTDEQCDALLRAAIASADPYCWLFIAFGLNTAMRHSEILAARFDQLDLDALRLFVPDAKAGQREQPITPELGAILHKERGMRDDQNGWVFPSPHADCKTGHRARMDRAFRDAVKAAGLNPTLITPHVMRHTAITKLVQAGVDLPTVQKISGHKTLAMVLRYAHVHGRHISEGIKALGRPLPELPSNEAGNTVTPKLHQRALRAVK